MRSHAKVVWVALAAAALGLVASLAFNGPGPLLRTEWGQRAWHGLSSLSAGVGSKVELGRPLPEFEASTLETPPRPVAVPTRFGGRPLLINVWASWCGPCIREMPELQRFSAQQGANGTQVLGIALDEPDAVEAFAKRLGVRYPLLIGVDAGPDGTNIRLGNPKGVLPYSVLVSADGRLLKQRLGPFAEGEVDTWARLD